VTLIQPSDRDFRICIVSVATLIEWQMEAEGRGWATRWSSVEALRDQVNREPVLMQTFLTQRNDAGAPELSMLHPVHDNGDQQLGAVTTFDVDPARYAALSRIHGDPDVRAALTMVFRLARGGIGMVAKQ